MTIHIMWVERFWVQRSGVEKTQIGRIGKIPFILQLRYECNIRLYLITLKRLTYNL